MPSVNERGAYQDKGGQGRRIECHIQASFLTTTGCMVSTPSPFSVELYLEDQSCYTLKKLAGREDIL